MAAILIPASEVVVGDRIILSGSPVPVLALPDWEVVEDRTFGRGLVGHIVCEGVEVFVSDDTELKVSRGG
jgi:hypothetical protein